MTNAGQFNGIDIESSIERLDSMLEQSPPKGQLEMGFALGTRLALGMAKELSNGVAIGSLTSKLIADWVVKYGEEQAEVAIDVARKFLTNPQNLKEGLEKRFFPGGPGAMQ